MKLDFLKVGSPECPLLRIYSFEAFEARKLHEIFKALSCRLIAQSHVDEIEAIDDTHLTFTLHSADLGVIETKANFLQVMLTEEGWLQAADLTEPFCEGSCGFQWLTPGMRGIQLLLSKDGTW